MGYWDNSKSFTGDLTWGDIPADILGDALDKINEAFKRDIGRSVTIGELKAGLGFVTLQESDDVTWDDVSA